MTNNILDIFKDGFDAEQFDDIRPIYGHGDPQTEFYEYMVKLGYQPNFPIPIGTLTRVTAPDDKKGKQSGWFVLNVIENEGAQSLFGTACLGSWRDGREYIKWTSKDVNYMTQFELEQVALRQKAAHNEFLKEKKRVHSEVADKAQHLWNNIAQPANDDHPYLKKKGVKAHGIKQHNDELIIPVLSSQNTIMSWQRILADGSKWFKKGGEKQGGFYRIDGDDSIVYLTEGYATAASIYEATGNTVYIAFDSGNLPVVAPIVKAKHGTSTIIVAGDNDLNREQEEGINTGKKSAEEAARTIGAVCILSPVQSDFNDLHASKGLSAVKKALIPPEKEPEPINDTLPNVGDAKLPPPPTGSALGTLCDFYMSTCGSPNEMFAMQTALALCGTFISREFVTDEMNFSPMFYVSVGESSSGKGHGKKIVSWVLNDTDMANELMCSAGFHSDSAVLNECSHRPRGLSVIDEMGLHLLNNKSGNGSGTAQSAITQLMDNITNVDGIALGKAYSAGALIGSSSNKVKNNFKCHNPSISVLGLTVPRPFFEAVGQAGIVNGLLSRFIVAIVEEDLRPSYGKYTRHKTPKPFIEWVNAIRERTAHQIHIATQEPTLIKIPFFHNCEDLLREMADYQFDRYQALKVHDIEAMANRIKEWSMRMSLIVALAEDANAQYIDRKHLQWAFDYVKYHHLVLCEYLKNHVATSEYDRHRNEFLNKIRGYGDKGMPHFHLSQKPPFKAVPEKFRLEIIKDLVNGNHIAAKEVSTNGRPKTVYKALRAF